MHSLTPILSYLVVVLVGFGVGRVLRAMSETIVRRRATSPRQTNATRSLVIESATAASFLAAFVSGTTSLETVTLWMAVAVVITAAEVDRRIGIIPNAIVLLGAAGGLAAAFASGVDAALDACAAGVAVAGFLFLARQLGVIVYGVPAMGMGDVKLAGAIGLLIGWTAVPVLWVAFLCGALTVGVQLLSGSLSRTDRVPFGPFIAAGLLLILLVPKHALHALGF